MPKRDRMQTLSPELALVDSALATAARAALPQQPDVFDLLERQRAANPMRLLRTSAVRADRLASSASTGQLPRVSRWLVVSGVVSCAVAAIFFAATFEGSDHQAQPQADSRPSHTMDTSMHMEMPNQHHAATVQSVTPARLAPTVHTPKPATSR